MFTLKIEMGNETMQDGHDVADALARVGDKLRLGIKGDTIFDRDRNGNSVGQWTLMGEEIDLTERA